MVYDILDQDYANKNGWTDTEQKNIYSSLDKGDSKNMKKDAVFPLKFYSSCQETHSSWQADKCGFPVLIYRHVDVNDDDDDDFTDIQQNSRVYFIHYPKTKKKNVTDCDECPQ